VFIGRWSSSLSSADLAGAGGLAAHALCVVLLSLFAFVFVETVAFDYRDHRNGFAVVVLAPSETAGRHHAVAERGPWRVAFGTAPQAVFEERVVEYPGWGIRVGRRR
jgi:hypothetical protein